VISTTTQTDLELPVRPSTPRERRMPAMPSEEAMRAASRILALATWRAEYAGYGSFQHLHNVHISLPVESTIAQIIDECMAQPAQRGGGQTEPDSGLRSQLPELVTSPGSQAVSGSGDCTHTHLHRGYCPECVGLEKIDPDGMGFTPCPTCSVEHSTTVTACSECGCGPGHRSDCLAASSQDIAGSDAREKGATMSEPQITIGKRFGIVFAWYDLWVGAYWNKAKRRLYVLPCPCVGFFVDFRGSR
jgi:hypothetical protein